MSYTLAINISNKNGPSSEMPKQSQNNLVSLSKNLIQANFGRMPITHKTFAHLYIYYYGQMSIGQYLNNRTDDFLLLLLPNKFAHFTKIDLTWPFIKLGPSDFAWLQTQTIPKNYTIKYHTILYLTIPYYTKYNTILNSNNSIHFLVWRSSFLVIVDLDNTHELYHLIPNNVIPYYTKYHI